MAYQYGQGFEKDLESLAKLIKNEYDMSDFDPQFLEIEIKKIIKFNNDSKSIKKEIGRIGVDAGLVYIVDPCYVKDQPLIWDEEKWQEFVKEYYVSGGDKENFAEMCGGVIFNTHHGDGSYPVIATFDKEGSIEKIEIDFRWDEDKENLS